MEDIIIKEAHPSKTRIVCSCCGHPFLINSSDKREPWCSSECRARIVRGTKKRPKEREKSVRELVDDYISGDSDES